MKYLLGLVLCALLGVGNAVYCEDALSCEDNECCVATYASQLLGMGWCTPLGRVGSPCNKPESKLPETYGEKFFAKCPCREKLECEGLNTGIRTTDNASLRCKRYEAPPAGFNKNTVGKETVAKDVVY